MCVCVCACACAYARACVFGGIICTAVHHKQIRGLLRNDDMLAAVWLCVAVSFLKYD